MSDNTWYGTPGNDTLIGGDFNNDAIDGGAGNDSLVGNGGDDSLYGGQGSDSLHGGNGNDLLMGMEGYDFMTGGAGNDTLDGGQILDRANLSDRNEVSYYTGATPPSTQGVNVNLETGVATDGLGGTDMLVNVNWITGTANNDTITGNSSGVYLFEQFEGRGGDDTINGGAFDPLVYNGNRVAYVNATTAVNVNLATGVATDGEGGTDTLQNINNVRAGNFNDTITGSDSTAYSEGLEGRAGNDSIVGGGGNDQARYDSYTMANGTIGSFKGIVADLETNLVQDGMARFAGDTVGGTDTLSGIEGIRGGNFDDTIYGSDTTGQANDFQFFHGTGGNDYIDGRGGYDRVDYNSANFGVQVTLGGSGTGTAQDGLGYTDTLVGIEAVRGSDYNDNLVGSDSDTMESFEGRAGNDFIDGRGGVDRVDYGSDLNGVTVNLALGLARDGFGGTDWLQNIERVRGSIFDDSITGSFRDETLEGNAGKDDLTGNGGNDTFVFAANAAEDYDIIKDFSQGDVIQVRTSLTSGTPGVYTGAPVPQGTVRVGTFNGVTTLFIQYGGMPADELRIDLQGTYNSAGFTVTNGTGSSTITYTGTVTQGFGNTYGAGDDTVEGVRGPENLNGADGNDSLSGDDGRDTLVGGNGNDTLRGEWGSDTLIGGAGNDVLDGGEIGDRINYTDLNLANFSQGATTGAVINLQTGVVSNDGQGGTDSITNVNFIVGTAFNDSITGSNASGLFEQFEAGAGNDTINGGLIDAQGTNTSRVSYAGNATSGATSGVNVNLATGQTTQDGFGNTDTLVNITNVRGSTLNDTIVGSDRTDFVEGLEGNAGNDVLTGGGGLDQARYDTNSASTGGANANLSTGIATDGMGGTDTLSGIEGLRGGNFNDTLTGSNNTVAGSIEFFLGGGGNDTIDGGGGFDRVDYTSSDYGVYVQLGGANPGNATDGLGGFDTLLNIEAVRGSEHNDVLRGSAAAGLESFEGRAGNDTIDGDAGVDRVEFGGSTSGVMVDLVQNFALDGLGGRDQLFNIENIRGSGYGDHLVGNFQNNAIEGQGGDDIVDGGQGSDTLTGGAGLDKFIVSNAPGDIDVINGIEAGETIMYAGAAQGVDLNQQFLAGGDPSTLQQGRVMVSAPVNGVTRVHVGLDSINGADLTFDIVGNIAANHLVATYTPDDVQVLMYRPAAVSITGTAGDDFFSGSNFNDTITGGEGNDALLGFGGNDSLDGGNGDDEFLGDLGVDTIVGGAGFDTVWYDTPGAMTSAIVVNLNTQTVSDGTQVDSLSGIEGVSATSFNDTLYGSVGGNMLWGWSGNDLIYGQATNGNNLGGAYIGTATGGDDLQGGLGDDAIQGSTGNDTLSGGDDDHFGQPNGSDTFFFAAANNGVDTIRDFTFADKMVIGGVFLGNPSVTAGNGATVGQNQVQAQTGGGMTTLYIGTDTVAGADIQINLQGTYAPTDFVVSNVAGGSQIVYAGGETLNLGPGNDNPPLGNGNDSVSGGDGNDNLFGAGGNDTLRGDNGDDWIGGGAGNDSLDGGNNFNNGDWVDYFSATGNTTVNLGAGGVGGTAADGLGGNDALAGFENVAGSNQNDTLVGNEFNNQFNPRGGNDSVNGGAGRDTVFYNEATAAVVVNLQTGAVTGGSGNDTLTAIEQVQGSQHGDNITLADGGGFVNGQGGSDVLNGGNGDDVFMGGSGADSITGNGGFDTADYGDPNFDGVVAPANAAVNVNLGTGRATDNWGNTDTLAGIELVRGSFFSDVLTGGNVANDGFEGFTGNGGNDTINGGTGFDRAQYDNSTTGVQVTLGGSGNGTANDGWGGTDVLIGIEEVRGSSFNDNLVGSDIASLESFEGRGGNDFIDGRGGIDRVNFQTSPGGGANGTTGVMVNLAAGTANDGFGGVDTLLNIENVRGSESGDTLIGDGGNNELDARGGNDSLSGGAGADSLRGGTGNDTLDGGSQLSHTGWDATANTSPENDVVFYSDATFTGGVNVDLGMDGTNGTASDGLGGTDTLRDVEYIIGSNFGDVIRGSNRAVNEYIRGGAGNDTMFGGQDSLDGGNNFVDFRFTPTVVNVNVNFVAGTATGDGNDQFSGFRSVLLGAGADTVLGDAQDNYIDAGAGNDSIDGGAGSDSVSYSNASGGVTVSLATNSASGADGTDTLANIENVRGSEFNDNLTGNAGNNRIQGRAGNDVINGGDGNDMLHGGFGNDTLTGGAGADAFQYSSGGEGSDTITDFGAGDSIVVFQTLNAGVSSEGNGSTVGMGQVQATSSGGVTTLFIGTDTVAGADITITLNGSFSPTSFQVTNPGGGGSVITYVGGTVGPDNITADGSDNAIGGGEGNDTIRGMGGNDTLGGDAGDDWIDGGAGNDTLTGGSNGGNGDTLDFASATTGVNVNFGTNTVSEDGTGGADSISGFENVNGTGFNDTLVGDAFNNSFNPGEGNDSVNGGDGRDFVNYFNATNAVTVNLATQSATGGAGNDTLQNIEAVNGSAFGDTITLANAPLNNANAFGFDGNDTITGGNNDDFLTGGNGADSITGGLGFDTADYSNTFTQGAAATQGITANLATGTATDNWGNTDTLVGIELVRGTQFADSLTGGNVANDAFEGFTGNGGNDTITGGSGFDRASYDTSSNAVTVTLGGLADGTAQDGLGGTDVLRGIEEVRGGSGNDVLTGSNIATLESFEGRQGNDTINGMGGIDRVNYQTTQAPATGTLAVTVNLTTGTASDGWGGTDTLSNIENVRGSEFNDSITGNTGDNDLDGRGGNDTLNGGAGQDSLRGGAGDDVLNGGSQSSILSFDQTSNTGGQVDIAFYDDVTVTSGVTVTLGADGTAGTATGGGGNDTLVDIEMVIGSAHNDVISGTNRAVGEIIRGGAGNDTLSGGAATGTDLGNNFVDYRFATDAVTVNLATGVATGGDGTDSLSGFNGVFGSAFNDSITGTDADNYLEGNVGNDTIDGGAGVDLVSYSRATAGVTIDLAGQTSGGADGVDTLVSIEGARGSEFNDSITGSDIGNRLQGRDGNDTISGGAGADSIHGGFGNDSITGGAGNDVFMYGTSGEGTDRITDFTLGDVIRISSLLTNSTGVAGTGTSVTGKTMQVSSTGGVTTLFVDTDNVAGADVTIQLQGTFSASSFAITNDAANGVANITRVPNGTGGVTIHGTIAQGQTIFLNHTLGDPDGLGTISYQWMANGADINGATGGTLLLTEALVGKTISVRASWTDATGIPETKTSATTAAVANVNDAPVGAVSVAGNPVPGQTLTASNNLTDADGMGTVAYQWIVNGAAVTVGTTYNFTEANINNTIQAEAVYTDGRGTLERVRSGVYVGFGSGDDGYTGSALGDKFFGNVGSDTLTGGAGNDTIDGGGDTDVIVYSGARSAYTISTVGGVTTVTHNNGGVDGVDTLTNVEDLKFSDQTFVIDNPGVTRNGTPAAEQLVGTAGDDVLVGFAGNDYLYAGEGRDYLYGGDGVDILLGEGGNDILLAEAGDDYLYGGTGHDAMYGGTGINVYLGGGGNDTMYGGNGSIEYFYGEAGNNFAYGDAGVDVFVGEAGNDTFFGQGDNDYAYAGSGNDSLFGGAGVDVLLGQNGDDYFEGGLGTDYLFMGAAGNDTVVVNKATSGVTLVYEFEIGGTTDQIRLQGTGWTSLADVQANSYDYESFSIIVLDADTSIWLIGARPAQFTAADFQFS